MPIPHPTRGPFTTWRTSVGPSCGGCVSWPNNPLAPSFCCIVPVFAVITTLTTETPQSACFRHARIMNVDDSPTAAFFSINLRFAPLRCDLLATIFHRCVKGPSELRPRSIPIDVNLRWIRKQLALGEQSHRVFDKSLEGPSRDRVQFRVDG
jgi:hypothetical protein